MKILNSFFLFFFLAVRGVFSVSDEYRLLQDLFVNHSSIVRPVKNSSHAVKVVYGAAIQQIIDMDEKNQILVSNLWIRMGWTDENFVWDPKDYGDTKVLIVPNKNIWTPDIILYNTADESFNGMMDTNAQIYSDGYITWFAPAIFKSTCKVDVTYFPFDKQYCSMTFGSWAYHGLQLDVLNRSLSGDTSAYIDNGEWQLDGFPVVRNVFYYNCCKEPYPSLTFTLEIQRRALFYLFNLLCPCMLISLITLLDFYLPAEAGEKVTLGITILLALTVFLLLIAETIPATSEVVPLIGQYFLSTIILVSLSTVMTVIVLSLHFRVPGGTRRVPRWVRTVFLNYLARFFCLGNLDRNGGNGHDGICGGSDNVEGANGIVMGNNFPIKEMTEHASNNKLNSSNSSNVYYSRFDGSVSQILKQVTFIAERYKDQDVEDEILSEWKLLAMVVDRILLLFFFLATVGCTGGILGQAPPGAL